MNNESSRISWPGATLLAPVPAVLISCGTMEKPNAFTVAWTGILCSNPPVTYISVRPERYSYGLIEESGVFCINLVTRDMTRAADFCGVRSGRNMDKLKVMGLHAEPATKIDCPMLKESPLALECRVREKVELGTHHMFIADIEAVAVDSRYIDRAGRLEMEKMDLMTYAHGEYFSLGDRLGSFGYTVKKKQRRASDA